MNERTVAEIVAALRQLGYSPHDDVEAADLLERLDALRPTCPTCDGSGEVIDLDTDGMIDLDTGEVVDTDTDGTDWMPCPENGGNCDGKMTFETMSDYAQQWIAHLRQRGTQP